MFKKTFTCLLVICLLASVAVAQTRTVTITTGADLEAAYHNNDEIILASGAVFTGNFKFTGKTTPTVIRAATPPPVGTRAIATHVLPKIVSPNAGPALEILDADNITFVGIDFGVAENVTFNFGVVKVGTGQETSLAQLPANITFERCLIHGNANGDMKRGIEPHAVNFTLKDSSVYNIHAVGTETQAIAGWGGAGPYLIENNYIEAAGINVLFGGADPKIANVVPSDIRIVRNLVSKPLTWNPHHPAFAGKRWSVKNLFELKNARRVTIDGNVFENNWVESQAGPSILFTPRNQDGTAPWSTVEDVTFINNIVRNVAAGVSILGTDDIHSSQPAARIRIENTLFYNVGGPLFGGNGRLFQIIGVGSREVTIRRTTAIHTDGNLFVFDGQNHSGFVYESNISVNSQGIRGSGASEGSGALNMFAPGARVTGNVFQGRPAASYPTGNLFPASVAEIGFVDLSSGNYGLSPTSPFLGKGADVAAINAAIGGNVAPPPVPPTPPTPPNPPPSPVIPLETTSVPVISMEGAVVAFTLSYAARARVEYGFEGNWTNTSAVQAAAINHIVVLPNLRANRRYNYRIVVVDANGTEAKSKAFLFSTCRTCR